MTQDNQDIIQPVASSPSPGGRTGDVQEKGPKPRVSEDTLNLLRIVICLALLFPIVQLYFTIPSAISMWVADQFVPFVNMIYFILVIVGGLWLIRYTFRFSDEERKRMK